MATIYNINYIKGDTLNVPLIAKNDLGNIIDLSSYSLRGSAKYRYSSVNSILDFDIIVTNASQGLFSIYLAAEDSFNFPIVEALYDIELYDENDSFVTKIYQGKFNIFPEVTSGTLAPTNNNSGSGGGTGAPYYTNPPSFSPTAAPTPAPTAAPTPAPTAAPLNNYKIFYGTIAGPSTNVPLLNSSQINGLQNSVLSSSLIGNYQGIYNCPAITNGYKYICYPIILPEITTSIDYDSTSPSPFNNVVFYDFNGLNYYIISVTVNGATLNYRVYRTASRSNSALRIQIT